MTKYTFKFDAADWVHSGKLSPCFSQYTTSRVDLEFHDPFEFFLPSKFLEAHSMNTVRNKEENS